MRSRYYRCSLCDQEFNSAEESFEQSKKRHEDWHNPQIKCKTTNRITGEVKWI